MVPPGLFGGVSTGSAIVLSIISHMFGCESALALPDKLSDRLADNG